jgi:hypothetical protein
LPLTLLQKSCLLSCTYMPDLVLVIIAVVCIFSSKYSVDSDSHHSSCRSHYKYSVEFKPSAALNYHDGI